MVSFSVLNMAVAEKLGCKDSPGGGGGGGVLRLIFAGYVPLPLRAPTPL